MMRRQVQAVASAGVITVVVVALAMSWAISEYAALKNESALEKELNNSLNDLQFLTTEYLTTRTPRALKQWQLRHQRMGDFIENLVVQDKEVKMLMPEIATRHKTMGSLMSRFIEIERTQTSEDRLVAARRVAVAKLLRQVLAVSTLKSRIANIYEERETQFLSRTPVIIAAIILLGIAVMVYLYVKVLRYMGQSVAQISDALFQLGEGHFDTPILSKATGDLGQVFAALENTRIRLAKATQSMEQDRADLDHFVYVASHDLKAPLRGIGALASWIEEDAGDVLDDATKENLHLMQRRIARLETLMTDLLAYSRAGRQNVPVETIDVTDLIDNIVGDLNLPSGVKVECVGPTTVILSPKVPLAHVLTNLISNAVKHHDKANGCIEIFINRKDDGHVFRVCDDGPGIPKQYRDRIFEIFKTLKPRDQVEGSGMGLAIAKRLVQSYNGAISIVGDDSRGTCVEFTWHPIEDQNVEFT